MKVSIHGFQKKPHQNPPINVSKYDNMPNPTDDFLTQVEEAKAIIPDELTNATLKPRETLIVNGVNIKLFDYPLNETVIKSFKGAGAFLAMARAAKNGKKNVVAASAGNHAQGVAYSAAKLEMKAHIFMPQGTSKSKIDATKRLGGENVTIHLVGDNFDQAKNASKKHLKESVDAIEIHPFNDPDVILGQAVHTEQIIKQMGKNVAMILMGIGGGGLYAGATKFRDTSNIKTVLVGVEGQGGDAAGRSIKESANVKLDSVNKYPQGTAVAKIGNKNFDILAGTTGTNEYVTVTNAQIAVATAEYTEGGQSVETAGALGRAAIMYSKKVHEVLQKLAKQAQQEGKESINVVNIITGGNISPEEQVMRNKEAQIVLGQRKHIEIEIPENQPGQLKKIAQMIRDLDINITDFQFCSHQYVSKNGGQVVHFGLQHKDPDQIERLINDLENSYKLNQITPDYAEKVKESLPKISTTFEKKVATAKPSYCEFSLQIQQGPGSLLNLLNLLPNEINIESFKYHEASPEEPFGMVSIGFNPDKYQNMEVIYQLLASNYDSVMLENKFTETTTPLKKVVPHKLYPNYFQTSTAAEKFVFLYETT